MAVSFFLLQAICKAFNFPQTYETDNNGEISQINTQINQPENDAMFSQLKYIGF